MENETLLRNSINADYSKLMELGFEHKIYTYPEHDVYDQDWIIKRGNFIVTIDVYFCVKMTRIVDGLETDSIDIAISNVSELKFLIDWIKD